MSCCPVWGCLSLLFSLGSLALDLVSGHLDIRTSEFQTTEQPRSAQSPSEARHRRNHSKPSSTIQSGPAGLLRSQDGRLACLEICFLKISESGIGANRSPRRPHGVGVWAKPHPDHCEHAKHGRITHPSDHRQRSNPHPNHPPGHAGCLRGFPH